MGVKLVMSGLGLETCNLDYQTRVLTTELPEELMSLIQTFFLLFHDNASLLFPVGLAKYSVSLS